VLVVGGAAVLESAELEVASDGASGT
jgi:hypothetical protein